ncbi:hypothetical protein [uncultured Acetatifactor sp.]|uniref:hypothetical protein n=1 Tax=uncultured Acetatifactor sp. TaxID=1671927 RepID=UPI0026F39209|nr:hypothetical protein [uncultured Acetatifactor sp.]
MTAEELRQMDITPFDCGAMADGMDGCLSEREETALFTVMLRYLNLLVSRTGLSFEIPLMNLCLNRDDRYSSVTFGFHKRKTEIMKRLYDNIMLGAGWGYGICRIDDIAADWKPWLSGNCDVRDWERAVSLVPEILALHRNGFQDITVTVCWSTRIANYLEYAALHPEEVETVFGEEAGIIRRILCKMADPYAAGCRIQCHQGGCYVMAYYEGRSDEVTISQDDMDYNFFVQGIALHLLLSRAEELFGLPVYAAGSGQP